MIWEYEAHITIYFCWISIDFHGSYQATLDTVGTSSISRGSERSGADLASAAALAFWKPVGDGVLPQSWVQGNQQK
jgi:hypothetical protein